MICLSEKKIWVRQSMCLPNPKKDLPKANEVIALGKSIESTMKKTQSLIITKWKNNDL